MIKLSNTVLVLLFVAWIILPTSGQCQQLGLSLIFANYKTIPGYYVESRGPGYTLSFDNINLSSDKKYFLGGQMGYIPTIYVEETSVLAESMKIMKLAGSAYAGRLLKLSNRFFLSGSAGVNLGYGQIKSWEDNDWIKVPQTLFGLRTAEQLHIRVKRSAIIIGFEQWLMVNSSTITAFKFGYSFNLAKK